MIIVSGPLFVDPDERDAYLAADLSSVEAARRAPGCLDFYLSPDPLDPGRINVYEQWEAVADVHSFRQSGSAEDHAPNPVQIRDAKVLMHVIASSSAP